MSPSPSAIAAAGVDPRTDGLEIGFGEWAVTSEATVIRPGRVTFLVRNGGELTHGFELEADEESGRHGSDGDDEREIELEAFASGTTLEISTTLPAGTYEIYCWIGDHEDRGMRTQLVVRDDAPLVTPDPAPSTNDVEIAGFAFGPAALRVPVGTEVTWTNSDPTPHTVTADSGSFASPTLDAGGAFAFRFDAAGTYSYICQIHPSMKGSVVVAP
ncbi:MAG TPA: plastocyanin/azurin family copper-binding protein [Patescibacteria group bacterium]|nr:plastocyanin/azurin family copper-binding protein [Patescibacteria group bacterium]